MYSLFRQLPPSVDSDAGPNSLRPLHYRACLGFYGGKSPDLFSILEPSRGVNTHGGRFQP